MKQTELEKAAEALKDEINEYEKRLIWGENWREVFDNINKEMNMEKLTAIAFGEWILKHNSYPISDDRWLVARGVDPVTVEDAFEYVTTEQLYDEFIKSQPNV